MGNHNSASTATTFTTTKLCPRQTYIFIATKAIEILIRFFQHKEPNVCITYIKGIIKENGQ